MKLKTRIYLIYFLLLALAAAQPARAQESVLNGFDDYVNRALKEWEVPGLAIAIVKNDQVVLAKGYGVRNLGDPTPVNDKTLFAIGSASKAFTAASVAMLVDEGKLKWDDPATQHLPGFQLYDPYATRELTVRDLLCHRSGLERGDRLWYASPYSREEVLRRVRHLKPAWSLRSRYGYQNIMYLAAGQVVAQVSGKSWDEFVKQGILTPLSMTATGTSTNDLKAADNVATPHARLDEKVQSIAWRNIDNIGPAGSINSNITDMAQWVRLQLGQGKYQDAQLISSGAVKEMHMPQTVIRLEGIQEKIHSETHFMNYGLGWVLMDYRGRKVVQHGGNIDGMSALVAMMPEEKLGMVILTNMNGTPLPTAIMYKVFDAYLQAPRDRVIPLRDWSADILKVYKGQVEQAKAAAKKVEDERVKGTWPSLQLAGYAGSYANDMYGEVKVAEENGNLVMRFGPNFVGELEHWHYDTFRVNYRDPLQGKGFLTFALNAQGKVEDLKIQNLADFKRAPDKVEAVAVTPMSEEDLRRYVGKYELKTPPLELSVELIGGKLKGVIPGQPVSTLVPITRERFKVVAEGAPVEIYAQFEMAEGKVKTVTIEQGGMKFTLLPKQ